MGIELLRGIAALMVMLTHYAAFLPWAPAGLGYLWTGVDFFFVLSGFVFSPMLLSDRQTLVLSSAASTNSLPAFWLRRFFRIYPLYLLALIAYFVAMPADALKLHYFLRHLAFLHTTESFAEAYYFNPAFWSLPVEIEYYLLLPLLALCRTRPRVLAGIGLATLLLSLIANLIRGPGPDFWRILSVHLPAILPEFLLGTLLAKAVGMGRQLSWQWHGKSARLAFGTGLLLLIGTYLVKFGDLGLETNRWLDAPWNVLCAAGYALVSFPLLLLPTAAWSPGWTHLARTCGAASYGVYLFHNLLPILLRYAGWEPAGTLFVLTSMSLTVILALLLYRWYENPLRLYGKRLSAKWG